MTLRIKPAQCLSLAAILALSIGAIWCFVCLNVLAPFRPTTSIGKNLAIQCDGTPLLRSWVETDDEDNGNSKEIVRTLDGKQVKITAVLQANNATDSSLYCPRPPSDNFDGLPSKDRIIIMCDHFDMLMSSTLHRSTVWWYFIHDGNLDGRGYFVAYDTKTNLRAGYIGRNGYRVEEPSREEQFHIDGRTAFNRREFLSGDTVNQTFDFDYRLGTNFSFSSFGSGINEICGLLYLNDDDGLVGVSLKKGTVRRIWRRGNEPVTIAFGVRNKQKPAKPKDLASNSEEVIYQPSDSPLTPNQLVLLFRFRDRVLVTDLDGKPIQTYLLPKEFMPSKEKEGSDLLWIQLADNRAVVLKRGWSSGPEELYWYNPSGKIVRHESVDLREPPRPEEEAAERRFVQCSYLGVTAPCGLITAGIGFFEYGWSADGPTLLIAGCIILFWPCLCIRRQRRYGLRSTWMWGLFVLLFGLPGYVGYRFHRRWPARLPCPHCGRRAPRDRTMCFHCGQDFPAPAAKGTEIFA